MLLLNSWAGDGVDPLGWDRMIVQGFGAASGKYSDCFGRNVGYMSIIRALASERYGI